MGVHKRTSWLIVSGLVFSLLVGCGSTVKVVAPSATTIGQPGAGGGKVTPADPAPVTSPPANPSPKPTPAPPPGMQNPVVTPPVPDSVPSMLQPISVKDATAIIGLSLADAGTWAKQRGWSIRVSTLDGESQMVTADFQPTRINVAVTKGTISAIDSIG